MSRRNLIIGKGKQGKTPWAADRARKILEKIPRARVLILSSSIPLGWNWVEATSDFDLLERFINGGAGILLFQPPGPFREVIAFLKAKEIKNTYIFWEDATETLAGSPLNEDERYFIFQAKNNGNEFFWVTHSLVDTPPMLRRYANRVVLFQTGEDVERNESRYWNMYQFSWFEILKQANKEVNAAAHDDSKWIQAHRIFETGL